MDDPSVYCDILGIPNDSSIEAIEEALSRSVTECEKDKNSNSTLRIKDLKKVREFLSNRQKKVKEISQNEKQISSKENSNKPECLTSFDNDLFLNEPSECFKKLNISENSPVEYIELIRQNFIKKLKAFTEKKLVSLAKNVQIKIKMCDILIKFQTENLKSSNNILQSFNQIPNVDSEPKQDEQVSLDPSHCFKELNIREDSSIEAIQSKRHYFIGQIDECVKRKHERLTKLYQEKLKLCEFLIEFKTEQMKLQIKQNSNQTQELHSEYLPVNDDSSIETIEQAYQRLMTECNYPCGKNSVSIAKSKELSEAYDYLKNHNFGNKDIETQMEIDEKSEIILNAQNTFPGANDHLTSNEFPMDQSNSDESLINTADTNDLEKVFEPLLISSIRLDNSIDQPNSNETFDSNESKDKILINKCQNKPIGEDHNGENPTNCAEEKVVVKKNLLLSFEDIFRGLTQKIFVRLMDGNECITDEIVRIKINPGILPNTEITCSAQNSFENEQTEFILVIKDKPDQKFKRLNEVDIEYIANITKDESTHGCELSIPTLENDSITMTFEDEITDDTEEIFTGRGLPFASNKRDRGKLVVRFKITDNPNDRTSSEPSYSNDKVIIEKQISKEQKEKRQKNISNEKIVEKQSFSYQKVENITSNGNNDTQTDQSNQFDEQFDPDDNFEIIDEKEAKDSDVDPEEENINISPNQILTMGKLPPNELPLPLTLEEIFRSGVKNQTIITKVINKQGIESQETKICNIEISTNLKDGDKIYFNEAGDKCDGKVAADVVFTVYEKPNSIFKRNGCDLEYIAKITQKEAILGGELSIPPLNGNKPFKYKFTGGITIEKQIRISRSELPVSCENNQLGDLVVIFDIFDMPVEDTEQDEPIEHDVMLTLEQIFTGCNKRVKITRNILDKDGNERSEAKILTMDIKPGTPSGTAFTFPREGDQRPGCIPADIVFIVQDKPHDVFRRIGSDIEHTLTLTKSEFSNGGNITIPTLKDDKPKEMSLDGIVSGKTTKKLSNYGLPIQEKPGKRGNLILRFNVIEDPQDDPIEKDLFISLEEVLTGCTKKGIIERKIFDFNGQQLSVNEVQLEIVIESGALEGTDFIYEKLGDKKPGTIPADVIFIVRYEKHLFFDQKGLDINYIALITKSEAKNGVELEVPTLEAKPLTFTTKQGIKNNDFKKFDKLGLPFIDDKNRRGDFYVIYKIVDDDVKDQMIKYELPISLQDIYKGKKKKKIKRKIVDQNGLEITTEKIIIFNIPPGINSGKNFIKPRWGDQYTGRIPADIMFVPLVKEHEIFKRKGNDLEYVADVTENDLMYGCEIKIPTLVDEVPPFVMPKDFSRYATKKIKGKGFPIHNQPNKRGDIVVTFKVVKPSKESKSILETDNSKYEFPDKLENKQVENSQSEPNSSNDRPIADMPQDEAIEYFIPVTLENILHGCTKHVRIKRKVFDADEKETDEDEIIPIEIKPGTEIGTKIIVSKAGDKNQNSIPADIIFIVANQIHPNFTRDGVNIEYTAKISQKQFKKGHQVMIPTLEGEPCPLKVIKGSTDITKIARISKLGLPQFDNPHVRGDILVKFEIVEEQNANKITPTEHSVNQSEQYAPISLYLPLHLEQYFQGFQDYAHIDHNVIYKENPYLKRKKLFINVGPGTEPGTAIYPYEDNETISKDIVFITTEIRHKHFRRNGADLFYTAKVLMEDAVKGGELEIPTIDGFKIALHFKGPIAKNSFEKIFGHGMPYPNDPNVRGNLIVQFDIYENIDTITKTFERIIRIFR